MQNANSVETHCVIINKKNIIQNLEKKTPNLYDSMMDIFIEKESPHGTEVEGVIKERKTQ
jgi:hypothetical protein